MDDSSLARRSAFGPRRLSAAAAVGPSELGANASLQDGETMETMHPARDAHGGPDRATVAAGRMERRNSGPQAVHQRHMPMEPKKFHIPRKTKEKKDLFQMVSPESREFEDMMTILTSSYLDSNSAGGFTYSSPRLVSSELLEKEFVEKRKEMKAEGRTDKELEESYCFLLADSIKVRWLCEKGLLVGQSWMTVLGNPSKGVYLSRYSDLLQLCQLTPGAKGEILIFKVMKGKVKSIYENMKNALDPTPRFDSHISKNSSKVTSLNSYRAFELTQHYFYEYAFDELRSRPRQVCPYAVVAFHYQGKDAPIPNKPLAPIRMNSQSAETSKAETHFTVWSGELVQGDKVLYQVCLRSGSPPFLPHRLPEKLQVGWLMELEKANKLLPPDLFSYNLYSGSQEVVKNGYFCSLLEMVDRSRSMSSVTRLLQELEDKQVVLVTPLSERGFLFLLSSVQMATQTERGANWKRCLQALFLFPETRDVAKSKAKWTSSSSSTTEGSGFTVMPGLNQFIPAFHHALVKTHANPPSDVSGGVEQQAREYLLSHSKAKTRPYPMGQYDTKMEECKASAAAPRHQQVNLEGYLRSYLFGPTHYMLSVARARKMVEAYCVLEQPAEAPHRRSGGGERGAKGKSGDPQANTQKVQRFIDLVLTCKRNAENEVEREEGREGAPRTQSVKRRMEQQKAERTLKFLRASQEPTGFEKIPVEGSQVPAQPDFLESVIGSAGLNDMELGESGTLLAAKLMNMLTGLNKAARGTTAQSFCEGQEEGQGGSSPFDGLAAKLGLPTNCDIDLRRQEELEEQTAGSISSLEGFSPSGETNHHSQAGRGGGLARRGGGYEEEEEEIPWVLIPITGLSGPDRQTLRDRNIPKDPRSHHLAMATSITTTTKSPKKSPARSPESSLPPSPSQCPSPDPSPPLSPSQCPSPEPTSPAPRPHCPSPVPSPPHSLSQCPSPKAPSSPPSPSQCPSPPPSPPSPRQSLKLSPPLSGKSLPPNKGNGGANKTTLTTAASRDAAAGFSKNTEPKSQGKEQPSEDPSTKSEKANEAARPAQEEAHPLGREERTPKEAVAIKREVTSDPPQVFAVGHIDGIVDKYLGEFSSDMQLLLKEESIPYRYSHPPNALPSAPPYAVPMGSVSAFSQYVSFYHPCPPVQDYVSSLQDSMNSVMTEVSGGWNGSGKREKPVADSVLASSVSAFVASIRAANAKTDSDDEAAAESAAPVFDTSGAQSGWQNEAVTRQVPMPTNRRTNQTPPESGTAFSSVSAPSNPLLHAPFHTPSHFDCNRPQSSDPHERTVTIRQSPSPASSRFVRFPTKAEAETGSGFAGVSCQVTVSGSGGAPEPPPPAEQDGGGGAAAAGSGGERLPSNIALSSLISKLQPEVFDSLVEIFKDGKRSSRQFYIHSIKPDDQVHEEVKEYLLKQGYVEQNPVAFMNQENTDNRLLVVIKNKDIAGHIHKIPGLVSLKRHPSVVFVGIDTPDDIRNKSYNELFVSGGCIVSDDLVLNADFISHDRLAAMLMILDQQSSSESVWRWKIHCKTHKKLKEQARFKRDAAKLLEVLSTYQRRQIVEFLPYHQHCDYTNRQLPDLDCLTEHQARYTHFRHTIFLTEHDFEMFPTYSASGIIVAGIDDILHNFTKLVGYHNIKGKQPIIDDLLTPKDGVHPVSSGQQVQDLLHQSSSSFPHLSDQMVPEASDSEAVPQHSHRDIEIIKKALSQFRAERDALRQQQQQQQHDLNSQASLSVNSFEGLPRTPSRTGSGSISPVFGQGPPTESAQLTPGRKAVAATLELIHSTLQTELEEEQQQQQQQQQQPWRWGGKAKPPAEGHGAERGAAPARLAEGKRDSANSDTPEPVHPATSSSDQCTATQTGPSSKDRVETPELRHEALLPKAEDLSGGVTSGPSCGPAEGDRSQKTQLDPGQQKGSVTSSNLGAGAKNPENEESITVKTEPEDPAETPERPHTQPPAVPQPNKPPHQSHPQALPPPLQRWSPNAAPAQQLHRSPFAAAPRPRPLPPALGARSLLGAPVWPGSAMLWGFQQPARELMSPGILGPYQNPAGQGNIRHRGWQRGGGFNGM